MRRLAFLFAALLILSGHSHGAQRPAAAPDEAGGEAAATGEFEARITSLEGEAYVFQKDEEEGVPAEAGMPVEAGDRIETRERSRAEVALEADSVFELGANTIFTVDALKKEESVFALSLGSFVAKFQAFVKKSRRHRILTPTAVAAVRGTEFGVEVGEDGDTAVGVFDEGEVAVTTNDESVDETLLKAQEETSVGRGEPATETVGGRKRLRRRMLEALRQRRERLQALRGRRAELRKGWMRLPPEERRRMREKIRDLHLERMRALPKGERLKRLKRLRQRVVKHKIDRGRHMKIREKILQRMGQRGNRGDGKNIRAPVREKIKQKMRQKQPRRQGRGKKR